MGHTRQASMRGILISLLIGVLCCLAVRPAVANVATGNATVIIEAPIIMSSASNLTYTRAAGVAPSLVTIAPTSAQAAAFTLTGYANSAFSLTLPSTVALPGDPHAIIAHGFLSNIGATGALNNGRQYILIGAQLDLPATTPARAYAVPFAVMVAYN